MKSNNLTLGEILNSPNQYVIPVFQRYYRWDQPEWDKLWADLTDLQRPEKTGRHFMGFLVLVPEGPEPARITRYYLIDGQQRLTTVSLLLCALRDAAKSAGLEELASEVGLTTLEHQFKKGADRFRVYPKLRDREQYIACINGEPPTEGRLGAAVRYFSGRLTTIPGAGTEPGLRAFFDLLAQRLEFIYARLEDENAFNIFKSLNSTGVPLGQSDLIRNFVFMNVPVADQDEFDESLWKPIERRFEDAEGSLDADAFSAFLRDYLMRGGEYIPPDETFEAFQKHYSATAFDPKQVAAELKQASEWYQILRGDRPDRDPEVEAALDGLRQLESSTTFSLLLNLYHRRHLGQIGQEQLATALGLLTGFILSRLVCGESSRNYSRMFVQASAALGDDPVVELRGYLESKGFPDTPRFVHEFVRFNLYGSRYRKSVLEALERSNKHKEPVVLTTAQVEHIMPQTLPEPWRADLGPDYERVHSTWLHTPGNLTLTGYNAELTNKPFAAKREEYNGSNIVMTRELARYETWGEAEIEGRGRAMAEVAARVWPGPAAPVRRVEDSVKTTPARYELRIRFWNGFVAYLQDSVSPLKPAKPKPYYSLRCGRLAQGVTQQAYINLKNDRIAVSAYFNGASQRRVYQALSEHRDAIEAEIGAKLVWSQGPSQQAFEIVLRNPVDPYNESLWPTYYDWMRRSLEMFQRVLGPRIAKLQPPEDSPGPGKVTPTGAFQIAYWSALRDRLVASRSPLKSQEPMAYSWTNFSIGRAGFHLGASALATREEIVVYLVIHGPKAKPHFHLLSKDRAAIEAELGEALEWSELPAKKQSNVLLRRLDIDPTVRGDWPAQHEWLQDTLEAFSKVFTPRIKALNSITPPEEEAPA